MALLLTLLAVAVVMERENKNKTPGTSKPSATNSGAAKELLVQSVEEQGDWMVVNTTYGVIKYPFAFSDLIRIETENGSNDAKMDFSAFVGEEEVMLYTLYFNKNAGITLGSLTVDGEEYTVTAVIHDLVYANEDNRLTYQAAQETFNDVAMSLEENDHFQAAQ